MQLEYKYYFEKINLLLKNEEIYSVFNEYINSKENPTHENKNQILKMLSNSNNLFSQNYTKNVLNKFDDIQNTRKNIINQDLEIQQEKFKQRLKQKYTKTEKIIQKEIKNSKVCFFLNFFLKR